MKSLILKDCMQKACFLFTAVEMLHALQIVQIEVQCSDNYCRVQCMTSERMN